MVKETGAKSTDLQSPESAEHLCGKCLEYAQNWKESADRIWKEHPYYREGYQNYKSGSKWTSLEKVRRVYLFPDL